MNINNFDEQEEKELIKAMDEYIKHYRAMKQTEDRMNRENINQSPERAKP